MVKEGGGGLKGKEREIERGERREVVSLTFFLV